MAKTRGLGPRDRGFESHSPDVALVLVEQHAWLPTKQGRFESDVPHCDVKDESRGPMGNTQAKTEQLGKPYGTASNDLRKMLLFRLLERLGENVCYRCEKDIETLRELSMDHIEPWFGVSNDLFWDLDNIAWSHLSCNSIAGNKHRKQMRDTRRIG